MKLLPWLSVVCLLAACASDDDDVVADDDDVVADDDDVLADDDDVVADDDDVVADDDAVADDDDVVDDDDDDTSGSEPLRTLVGYPLFDGAPVDDLVRAPGLQGGVVVAVDPTTLDVPRAPPAAAFRRVLTGVPRPPAAVMEVNGSEQNPNGAWVLVPAMVAEGLFSAEIWVGFADGDTPSGVAVVIGGFGPAAASFAEGVVPLVHDEAATVTLTSAIGARSVTVSWHRYAVTTEGFVGEIRLMVQVTSPSVHWVHGPRVTQPPAAGARSSFAPFHARMAPTRRERLASSWRRDQGPMPDPSRMFMRMP